MRRLILLPVFIILLLTVVLISRVLPAAAKPPAPQMSGPVCAFVCDKTGINTGWPGPGPESDYLRAQRVGMGWMMQIAGNMGDVNKTAEAINRGNAAGLHMIVRICSMDECELGTPQLYSEFLHRVAAQAPGEFWALMGPNEPDLEHWAGDGTGVAAFMNGTLDLVGDIPNLKRLSPGFNLTNKATPSLLKKMDAAGARWADLDGFAGTSYNLGGHPAYGYYSGKSGMRKRVLQYGKPFVFIETGTFAMTGKNGLGNPKRVKVVAALRKDFGLIVNDPTVMGVLYFNAFGDNPYMLYHVLYDPELVAISQDAPCTGGGYSPVGVGVSVSQEAWKTAGSTVCTVSQYGCPFVGKVACEETDCVDSDGDTFPGDGGACPRTDCDDEDATIGMSCGKGAADLAAGWGTLRVVDANVPAPKAWPVIKLGAGGLPVIGYRSGPNNQGDVTLLQCTAADCSTALRRVLVRANDSGAGLSMQVRSNGRPILAYLNASDYYLETYDCADEGCTSGTLFVTDKNVGQNGFDTSLSLLPGDIPSVAYWASGSDDLGVVTCPGGDCDYGTVHPYSDNSSAQTGLGPSNFVGPVSLPAAPDVPYVPYVVYSRHDSADQMRLLHCADDVCSTASKLTLVSGAQSLPTSGVVVRPDGFPLILYRNLDSGEPPVEALALFSCTTKTCWKETSPGNIEPAGDLSDIYTPSGPIENGSIALLPGGGLFIAISERISADDSDLVLIYCEDTACASPGIERISDGNVGEHPDVVIRPDDNPMVVYHDVSNGRLMVYDVDMNFVTGPAQPASTPVNTPIPTDPASTPVPTAAPALWAGPAPKTPKINSFWRGTPKFSWGTVKNAQWYQIEYDPSFNFDSNAGGPLFISGHISRTVYTPPAMPKGIYFWRVRAGNATSTTEWSVPRTLQIALAVPGKSSLVSPRSRAKISGGAVGLSWKATPGAAQYEVQVDTSKGFNSSNLWDDKVAGLSTVVDLALQPGTHWWRVRGLNGDQEPGPWSSAWTFTVLSP